MKTLLTLVLLALSTHALSSSRIDCKVRVSSLEQFYIEMNFLSKTNVNSVFFWDMGAGELRLAIPRTDVKLETGKRVISVPVQINSVKDVTIHLPEEIFTSKEEFDVDATSGSWVTDAYCWAK